MIDRYYGHLARDGREHAIRLLDALNGHGGERWTLVDAAWTSSQRTAARKRRLSRQKSGAFWRTRTADPSLPSGRASFGRAKAR
jgi:hypothetical protein